MIFTPDITVGDLKKRVHQKRYDVVRDRMRAVILRRQGRTFRSIAKTLNRSLDFVKTWNDRFKTFGAPGLETIRTKSSKPLLLSVEHQQALRKRVSTGPTDSDTVSVFTLPVLKDIVRKELGVECSVTTISTTLRGMGFRKVKPRPIHPKNSQQIMDQWVKVDLPFF